MSPGQAGEEGGLVTATLEDNCGFGEGEAESSWEQTEIFTWRSKMLGKLPQI